MIESDSALIAAGRLRRSIPVCLLLLAVALGSYLRIEGLGVRSLWRDELCTWHVSRMDVGESLRWGPELTKPPLYQFCLRLLTNRAHPPEWILRLPAALCGVGVILAGWWLGRAVSGWPVGLAMAALLACNVLQIQYSREARPYSMLVLGCTISTWLWYRMVTTPRRSHLYAYTLTTVLTLYANYLAVFTIFAQTLWWLWIRRVPTTMPRETSETLGHRFESSTAPSTGRPVHTRHGGSTRRPPAALLATGVLCLPVVIRYLYYRSSMFQGLEWIKPPTWHRALDVFEQLTFGGYWVFALFLPALVLWLLSVYGLSPKRLWRPGGPLFSGRYDMAVLLLIWWAAAWFGLMVVSWIAHPAMVPRYTLPAAVPALLFPLLIAHRLDRRAPLVIMSIFILASAPNWLQRDVSPGLRELSHFLYERVDREKERVVLTIDNTIYPGWEDSERLGFIYYPMGNVPLEELPLESDGVTPKNRVLQDPRGLYLVVLWADPFEILQAAGRQAVPIDYHGTSYSQLLFQPYRLVRVDPLPRSNP